MYIFLYSSDFLGLLSIKSTFSVVCIIGHELMDDATTCFVLFSFAMNNTNNNNRQLKQQKRANNGRVAATAIPNYNGPLTPIVLVMQYYISLKLKLAVAVEVLDLVADSAISHHSFSTQVSAGRLSHQPTR